MLSGDSVDLKKAFLILVILSFSLNVFANEAPPAAVGGKGEAKQPGDDKGLPEWVMIEAQIATLESKIGAKEENIKKIIEEKKKISDDSPKAKELIDALISEHNEMKKYVSDYEKQRTLLKFRFPERGIKADRKYQRKEMKSLEAMEDEFSLEGKLNKNIRKMRRQFPKANQVAQPETEEDVRKPASDSVDEAKSIILQK